MSEFMVFVPLSVEEAMRTLAQDAVLAQLKAHKDQYMLAVGEVTVKVAANPATRIVFVEAYFTEGEDWKGQVDVVGSTLEHFFNGDSEAPYISKVEIIDGSTKQPYGFMTVEMLEQQDA